MKIVKESTLTKPLDFSIKFINKGNDLYQVLIDGHNFGNDLFDADNLDKFIKN